MVPVAPVVISATLSPAIVPLSVAPLVLTATAVVPS
jgi:hypothetical protein